ncbi:MAG: hypothetical protein ABII23_06825 [bacterium]
MPARKPAITLGVELETYSIILPENRICRELHFPRRSTIEKGERFTRDTSIGSEYNSKVFTNIREAFFLLKNGLRKYTHFRQNKESSESYVIFPIGGWIDRFAGFHMHLAKGKEGISYADSKELNEYIHDHIPFLIALTANSPVWRRKLTSFSCNRMLRGTNTYCKITRRTNLPKNRFTELIYNKKSRTKPSTFEVRVCDSSVPEFCIAAMSICLAVALRWIKKKNALNQSTHKNYIKSRDHAVRNGVKAKITWSNHLMSLPEYIDLFFRKYREELLSMDIPDDIIAIFKYLKKGWNQAEVIREAVKKQKRKYGPSWEKPFSKNYIAAIQELLDGNSYQQFALKLGVKLPTIKRTWLGSKGSVW